MKMKKLSALMIAIIMVVSAIPAINISAAETTTVTASLSGDVVWSAPDKGGLYDAPVADIWDGWSSTGSSANLRTYDGYDVLQFYSAYQTNLAATVTASEAVRNATKGSDMVVVEWKHKWQSGAADCYYNFTFSDAEGVEIAAFTLDKNFTAVTDTYKLGFPENYTDLALVYYNNPDGETHSVEYYVAGEIVYTDSALTGTVSGFGSISGSDGWWTDYAHVGFANLTISTVINTESTVEVSAVYTAGDRTVKTETKRYDSLESEGVTFGAYSYSANGENVLYTTDEVTLSESDTITMEIAPNTGSYREGDTIAHEGIQYTVESDNLIPNADFSHKLTGWYACSGNSATASNFSVNGTSVTITGNGGSDSDAALFRAWDVEVGKTYFLTFTLDQATEWARVTEDDIISYSESSSTINVLKAAGTSVAGRNNLIFTANREYIRVNFAWAEGRTVSAFGLYEVSEAEETLTETVKTVYPLNPVVAFSGYEPRLPSTVKLEGSLGSIVDAPVTWNEPDTYPVGEKVTVEGVAEVIFAKDADAITVPVTVDVTVFVYDHVVETFYHGGDNSDSANFGMYNYLGSYNGGVIVTETAFSTTSGTNKLIMYGNSSTGDFNGTGALVRFMKDSSSTPFEYYNGGWVQSDIVPQYGVNYILRTTIDITNKTYTLSISADGGEFEAITPSSMPFRNSSLNSIDRMIFTGSMTITSHTTAWTEGFSYLNVEFVTSEGTSLRDGYRVKTATGVEYQATDAPKLIEAGNDLYILDNVDVTPSGVVEGDEDTLTISYTRVEMVEFESPCINHVRGDKAINLPAQVKMVFSDGQKILYPVTWDTTSVNTDSPGEYEIEGTIDSVEMKATATVNVRDLEILSKTTENTVVTNNGGWNWYVEPSGTHIQPGDALASRYESGQYSSNGGYEFKHDKTYMGWVEDEGTIVVGEYDHVNDTYKRVVVHEFLEADDHNNPAVVVLPDGRIMIFYSKHTTENRMYYCVSKNPEDITEWNDWQYYYCYTAVEDATWNATYPTVFIVHDDEGIEGNDVIYVGWRGVHWKPTLAKFSIPDENGVVETIMGQTQFANTTYNTGSYADGGRSDGNRRPYTKYDYDFDRNLIYITFTANHPDNDVNNNIYYVTLNLNDQNLYTAKGNLLQPLPFENTADFVSQGAAGTNGQWGIITNELVDDYPELLVFDSNAQITSGGERRGWTWDIKVNEKGEPCIVYVDVTATAPNEDGSLPSWYGPSVNDSTRSHHYYWYARWDTDTQTWVKTFLTYGGKWWHENATQERCYSGGLTFDHNAADANVIYLSIPTMGEYGNIFEIYRWESDDHGATWTIREPITENSKINNVRPNIIYNYKVDGDGNPQGPRLLWKSGEYRYWMNYEYKTGVWTDFAADGFITQDDPEMFADAFLYADGEKLDKLPTGEATVTAKFNITNISIGDGNVYLALSHYNSEGALVKVVTEKVLVPARSVPQIGMVGAPKTSDGSLSPMGTEEIVEEIEYTATFSEGDRVKLFAWNTGIEHPMSDITSVVFEMSTEGNKFAFSDTFTYEGTEKLILDENGENYNGWVSKAYGVDGAAIADNNYAAITKAPFGNTGLHLYGISSDESGIMASHALPDTEGKDYQIKFSMRYIDEMSWNNTTNAGFTLSHGIPVYNDGDATPCAIQFRHGTSWSHYNGRSSTGYVRNTRWFDGSSLSWIFGNSVYSEQGRGNEYDGLMTGSNYEVTINVSPANRTIDFSVHDGHRTAYYSTQYVDASTYNWDSNPIDTITFSVSGDKWGEIYVDDLTVEIME